MRVTLRDDLARILGAAAARFLDATILRFAAVGALTTVLDFVLFTLLVEAGAHVVGGNLASYSCGVLTSFALNNWWTFRAAGGRSASRALAKFVASNIGGLTLSTIIVWLFSLLIPATAAKLASVPLVFVWNFTLARFWVFR